ncbi:MAG: helix-turn-helix domain-containing protein [Candidatus Dormibacteria bacterium]
MAQRREPELLRLQEERGSTGFPHYILSRAGNLPEADWADAIYVMPGSLVEHLRPRCLGLGPAGYQAAALAAGAAALRRLHPQVHSEALIQLARDSRPSGRLPHAWWGQAPGAEPHQGLLWAAMTLREGRAYAHYQAARGQDLQAVELLVVSASWRGSDGGEAQRLFRWGDDEIAASRQALRARGWFDGDGILTAKGRAGREAIENLTEAFSDRLLAPLTDEQLAQLAGELPTSE